MFTSVFERLKNQEAKTACMLQSRRATGLRYAPRGEVIVKSEE